MDTLNAIKRRSSTRGYTEEKLTQAELDTIIDAGLMAPTATNRQEINFSVLDGDNPVLAELQSDLTGGRPSPQNFYYGAPTVIFLSGETAFHWSAVDAGIAVENMALAAEELGLGSLIIGCVRGVLEGEKQDYYAKKLGFADGYQYLIAIAVGHKAVAKEPHTFDRSENVKIIK